MREYTKLERENLVYWIGEQTGFKNTASDMIALSTLGAALRHVCFCGALPCRHVIAIDQDGENGPWLFICDAAHGEHSFEFQTDTNDFPLAVMLFAKELFTRYPIKK